MKLRSRIAGSLVFAMLASVALAEDSDLLVFDYSGYENPDFHSKYVEQHGDSPRFAFFGDEDEAFQKLVSGFKADVSHICAGSVTRWVESGILEPWDTARIPEYDNLNRDLTGAGWFGVIAQQHPTQ